MLGIYAYFDKKDNSVVYIGKDSNIDKNVRKYAHMKPSCYERQPFNRILQNNPNRYTYQVLVWDVKDQETLNALEIQYIRQLKPKFNFTDGGDGCVGNTLSEEQKKRLSDTRMGENNPFFGKKHSEETKRRMSKQRKGKPLSETNKENLSAGVTSTGFFRVSKYSKEDSAKNYAFRYGYGSKRITSVDIFTLKRKVETNGFKWKIVDIRKAIDTIREEVS